MDGIIVLKGKKAVVDIYVSQLAKTVHQKGHTVFMSESFNLTLPTPNTVITEKQVMACFHSPLTSYFSRNDDLTVLKKRAYLFIAIDKSAYYQNKSAFIEFIIYARRFNLFIYLYISEFVLDEFVLYFLRLVLNLRGIVLVFSSLMPAFFSAYSIKYRIFHSRNSTSFDTRFLLKSRTLTQHSRFYPLSTFSDPLLV